VKKRLFNDLLRKWRRVRKPADLTGNSPIYVWTSDEADAAWWAGRTEYNLGKTFRSFAQSLDLMTGGFFVDGSPARVVVCVSEAVKQRVLSNPDQAINRPARNEQREFESRLRVFLWTREEAEAAWKANRTETNFALLVPEEITSLQYFSGILQVDGIPAKVIVYRNEPVKQKILTPADKQRFDKEQLSLERQRWLKSTPDPEPIEGRTCQVCGGKLVLVILNYFRDEVTDVFTPADRKEECLACGRTTALIAPDHWRGVGRKKAG